jgi:predicted metal-dependent phosphoesterase TrpH
LTVIDLHVHTKPASPCSDLEPIELIRKAKQLGIDGVCLTEHDKLWSAEAVLNLVREYSFLLLRGVEVSTNHGHILVFGLNEYSHDLWRAEKLRDAVDQAGGLMIAAHPFRESPTNISLEQACKRPIFQLVDEIEVCNGVSSEGANSIALEVCRKLKFRGTGGSDAHSVEEVGRCVTIFQNQIEAEEDLVAELKAGRFGTARLGNGSFVPINFSQIDSISI